MDFETWKTNLKSDSMWWENMQMMHKDKDFEEAFTKVYGQLVSSGDFRHDRENRNHVHNILCNLKANPKPWYYVAEKKEEREQHDYLTGEARMQRLREWQAEVAKADEVKKIRPMSAKEIIENGDWKPKPPEIHEPSETEKAAALNVHRQKLNKSRRLFYLDAYPDSSEEEVMAYLKSFKDYGYLDGN